MTDPLVTVGVPVYRGQETLPVLLSCLANQSYKNLDVLISVDAADRATAQACEPLVKNDSRFRMEVQPARLGWAGNTDWTMRNRRGAFYIYQQHDDLISPGYVADLVAASRRWPNASLYFSKLQFTGMRDDALVTPSLLGDDPIERALSYLRRLDWVPFRGLIRGSALERTSGLLLSDFDPMDSLGTEHRFMLELAILGEFRFVEGPIYYKDWHDKNLSRKRESWSFDHWIMAYACYTAWVIEVLAPIGTTVSKRRWLFRTALRRFAGVRGVSWQRVRRALSSIYRALPRTQRIASRVRRTELVRSVQPAWQLREMSSEQRVAFLGYVYAQLKSGGRFDPGSLGMTWEELASRYFSSARRFTNV